MISLVKPPSRWLKFLAGLALLAGAFAAHSQPWQVSAIVSENQFCSPQKQKLVLVDFWATWCIPCLPATKQLEILQKEYPDDIFMVSISDEKAEVINQYLAKHPIQLMVASDAQGNLFRQFAVESRPYAVLFNQDGKALWKGHPADLSPALLDSYLAQQHKARTLKLDKIITLQSNTRKQQDPKNSFKAEWGHEDIQEAYIEDSVYTFRGALRSFIAQGYSLPEKAVSIGTGADQYIRLRAPLLMAMETRRFTDTVLKVLRLKAQDTTLLDTAIILKASKPHLLWDTAQLNFSDAGMPGALVGADRIEADNMSIQALAAILSNAKGKYFVYQGNDDTPHDWSFTYLYDDLMYEELSSGFGINCRKEYTTIPGIVITKSDN